ncbi:hypothetical protein LAZ67_4000533 [Cordylochernes scorpioides]|uniref:Uncharacterized protein n=1 Tax=Cordylochernes scorpioides TaxID=51811 RepID=A0ABY6KBD8_9ARAC|nr:hypothetical protein LAZ67_4000533 [Cordylochernes scorpioides]
MEEKSLLDANQRGIPYTARWIPCMIEGRIKKKANAPTLKKIAIPSLERDLSMHLHPQIQKIMLKNAIK